MNKKQIVMPSLTIDQATIIFACLQDLNGHTSRVINNGKSVAGIFHLCSVLDDQLQAAGVKTQDIPDLIIEVV